MPPRTCHAPNACSTQPATASAAGARRGSAPAYVAKRSMTIRRRGSRACARARVRSVCHGRTRRKSRGSGRRLAGGRHPRRPRRRAREERHRRAPHRRARAHEARPVGARARRPRLQRLDRARQVRAQLDARAVGEAIARHRLDAHELDVQRRARVGEELLEHPRHRQQRRPAVERESRPDSQRPALPPAAAPASSTVTACPANASRAAAASPPTPAPTTTTFTTSAAQARPQRRHGDRAHRQPARRRDLRPPPDEEVRDELAHPRPRVQRERAVAVAQRVVVAVDDGPHREHARARREPAEEVRRRDALVAPAAGPRPVALARHPRVEEDVPRRQRARRDHDPLRAPRA